MKRYHVRNFALLGVALLASTPSALKAGTVVVPSALASVDGGGNNILPFNLGQLSIASSRYQQVYSASEFPSSPIRITEIAFRPDGLHGAAFSATLRDVHVNLSTTPRAVGALSRVFADNVGLNETVVRSGALPLSSWFTGPPRGPKQFDITIFFSQPFDYYPSTGNLLLDVRNFLGGLTTAFDGSRSGSSTSRVTTFEEGSADSLSAAFIDVENFGLVTQFTYTAVPEPSAFVAATQAVAFVLVARRSALRSGARTASPSPA
ncbi:MAG: hypothetical protein ACRCT8_11020 [Lacipirellulaceae bacterium]